MSISVELLTEDEHIADVCKRFWQLNDEGKFSIPLDDLANECGGRSQLFKLLRHSCNVWVVDCLCKDCRKAQNLRVANRSDYLELSRGTVCHSCQLKRDEKRDRKLQKGEQKWEAEVDRFSSMQPFAGELVTTQPGRYAAVHMEIGETSQVIRFVNVTECDFHFETPEPEANTDAKAEGASAEAPLQGSLSLKGTVELGGCSKLISGDAAHYLVGVGSDWSFTIHRVQTPQPPLLTTRD